MEPHPDSAGGFEYVVVGSGAGGGSLAARLAEAGRRVLLLEAGGDPLRLPEPQLPDAYRVPAFHTLASENAALRWDFFVRHYSDDEQQRRDPKFCGERDGVLYPRAGTLGGCTAHNALILVYPHNADWEHIAELTGDASWSARNMRRYFQRLEDCRHRPVYRWLRRLTGLNPTRHGFGGWLATECALPAAALMDRDLVGVIARSAVKGIEGLSHPLARLAWLIEGRADPNDWRLVRADSIGLRYAPLTTRDHQRTGSRERLLEVSAKHPERLHIELDALAARVLLDADGRATGVEYLKGERLYRAHAQPNPGGGEPRTARATREVILCGGAFNTPQLLMLSGIGPKAELEAHGIGVRVDLPGVGQNLQDRYEVSVVHRMKADWRIMSGARFAAGDPQYREWETEREGVYTTNGGVLVAVKRSRPERPLPDLFCMALLARFEGYFPGYSKLITEHRDYLSWVVLKAHTANHAGSVTLRSADPRDPPRIDFRYFEEGSDGAMEDLDSVVDGIEFVRGMSSGLGEFIAQEELPGPGVRGREALRRFVRDHAWGHHASCTCPIGPRERGGVVSGDFRVHGTRNLRVVDASVFPKIPGFFIASSVYMIGEKAAEAILSGA